ncbi:hypothetical protein JYU34_005082 [Plutella xylostella]|uniref:Rho-GAP domain-containing protein n=1 Tax=Plutella xylostella TaxID=51655 RepID=A0ABQ7QVT2_PLUXY|nr:hypothetical protein JYU34_005082 [Plutella xylostella]
MDFESPDVEKDFPGLYASESGRKSNESDFSDGGDHEKPSKKGLLGRSKDKKEKKDRGYAALEGDSSPEEDTDTKSPSKSKKTKSFKFPTKSKEKREKSRDKEKVLEDAVKQRELSEKEKKKEKEREKEREREKKEKEKRDKLREKDKEKEEKAKFKLESKEKLKDDKKDKTKDKDKEKVKEKDKEKVKEKDKEKVKEKDKDKKEKKLTKVPSTVTSGIPFEEIFTLGVALPIFGVPLHQSVERSRCHDDAALPLLVRDSIDYLQAYGLKSTQIYRAEADKVKLQQLRKLYDDRCAPFPYHWDVPVACALIKTYLSELPESILTQELHGQFEQTTAIAETQRLAAMAGLTGKLPHCNLALLGWLMVHFNCVAREHQVNHATIAQICTYMAPALNMSQNLLTYLITKADKLFPNVELTKYIPPLLTLPAEFPDSASAIALELRKQESLLSQIHAEMHAGFITPARDQRLWEAQTILTQLKRKLRAVQKSAEPNALSTPQMSIEEKTPEAIPSRKSSQTTDPQISSPPTDTTDGAKAALPPVADVFQPEHTTITDSANVQETFTAEFEDNFDFAAKDLTITPPEPTVPEPTPEPVKEKPKLTEIEMKKLRLELENAEYLQLKSLLQAKINSEQFEIVKLRSQVALKNKQEGNVPSVKETKDHTPEEQELRQRLIRENAALEQKRLSLINQIFQERVACTQLKIEIAMKELL